MKIREVYFIGFLGFKTLVLQRQKVAFTVREPLGKTEGNPPAPLKKGYPKGSLFAFRRANRKPKHQLAPPPKYTL